MDGGKLVLIIGGARSGKSAFAEMLARSRGGDAVLFVATAEAGDEEMKARIARHRTERASSWKTLEAPRRIAERLRQSDFEERVVIVDCLTLLASNVLLADQSTASENLMNEWNALASWQRERNVDLYIISNEVGLGIVPENALARAYRDLLGELNQHVAKQATEVYLMVAGMPLEVKRMKSGSDSG